MKNAIFACLFFVLLVPNLVMAQETSKEVRAVVTNIEERFTENGFEQVKFFAEDGDETYYIDTSESFTEGLRYDIKEGSKVVLQIVPNENDEPTAYLSDVVRTKALLWIAIVFCLLTIIVGLWRGFFALIGLVITLAILGLFIFPRILAGSDPVVTTVIGSLLILSINMFLSHGFTKSTLLSYFSTAIGLGLVIIISKIFVSLSSFSGLASEEAVFLFWNTEGAIDIKGLLLASIILGAVGVLDDIAVAQSEVVKELKELNPEIKHKELFVSSMRIGRHHIASTVNTLVLAYAGAALPLFLLFMSSTVSFNSFINTELVAEEIVRTLSGTAALVLTVPIATLLASWQYAKK